MTNELKPCPFCGSANLKVSQIPLLRAIEHRKYMEGDLSGPDLFSVDCLDCYARGPSRPFREEDAVQAWDDYSAPEGYILVSKQQAEWITDKPSIEDFMSAVAEEMQHQRKRWGARHDQTKHLFDWIALAVRLLGKLVEARWDNDDEKIKHHAAEVIITSSIFLAIDDEP